jgi:hypothetical protein
MADPARSLSGARARKRSKGSHRRNIFRAFALAALLGCGSQPEADDAIEPQTESVDVAIESTIQVVESATAAAREVTTALRAHAPRACGGWCAAQEDCRGRCMCVDARCTGDGRIR